MSRKSLLFVVVSAVVVVAGAGLAAANLGGFTTSNSSADLNQGLIAHWQFDGDTSDQSPYDANGTPVDTDTGNGDGDTPPQPTVDRDGNTEHAYSFDGTDDVIRADANTRANSPGGFSMSAWVNLDDTGGTILEKQGDVEITPQTFKMYEGTIGEAGTFQSAPDGTWKTIDFRATHTDPVVVGTTNTHNGENGLIFEAKNVTTTSADMRVCESEGGNTNGCDTHAPETVGYLVIDAADTGSHAGIEAGTYDVDSGFDSNSPTVGFSETFGSAPVVFASVHTTNGGSPTEVRAVNPTTTDFELGLCHQDSLDTCDSGHASETVGWVAIEPGNHPFVQHGEAGSTGNSVSSSAWTNQSFTSAFDEAPVAIVETLTQDGGQDALIDEARTITTTDMDVRYCEMETGDTCDSHTSEDVGWFAVQPGPLSTSTLSMSHTLPTGSWTNVIYTHDGSTATIYENGSQVAQASLSTTHFKNLEFDIGELADGAIDNVRVYDRTLTTAEIDRLQQTTTPPDSDLQVSATQSKLIGHWSMGEGFGIKDRTPNGNDGTLQDDDTGNGDGDTPPQLTTDRRGNSGGAYVLDGTDDYIGDISHTIDWGSQDYTTNVWFKLDSLTASGDSPNIFRIFFGDYSSNFLDLETDATNFELSGEGDVNNEHWDLGDTGVAKDLDWHMLTITFTNGSVSGYIDGTHFNTIDTSGITQRIDINSLGRGNIDSGCCSSGYGDYWYGQFDDFRIYNRALSQQEIQNLADSYQPRVQVSDLQKGLVGHWSFNNRAKDVTPYDNHGTPQDADTGNGDGDTPPQLTTDRRGNADRAYNFDGTDDYINVGQASELNFTSEDFTLSAWVNYSSTTTNMRVLSKAVYQDDGYEFFVNDGDVTFRTYQDGSGQTTSASNVLNQGQWHLVTIVRSGSDATIYVDGQSQATGSGHSDPVSPTSRDFLIGKYTSSGYEYGGDLDDVRVYNRSLSANEVETLYNTYR